MAESWLNGWHRDSNTVLIGTMVHCAGCGKPHGLACVAFTDGWAPPSKMPDWPFAESDCPLCEWSCRIRDMQPEMPPRVAELYWRCRQMEALLMIAVSALDSQQPRTDVADVIRSYIEAKKAETK